LSIDNLIMLIGGDLQNYPSISGYIQVVFEAKNVRRGDLYFCLDNSQIDLALKNGAYVIVYDEPLDISDNEVAWIHVGNVQKAIHKFFRFYFLSFKITPILLDNITLALADKINIDDQVIVLNATKEQNYAKLWQLRINQILLSKNATLLHDLFGEFQTLDSFELISLNIIEQTLFQVSFYLEDAFYERVNLPILYQYHLEALLGLYIKKNLSFNMMFEKHIEFFYPQFVDKTLHPKEFGKSNRVLIFSPKLEFFMNSYHYIKQKAKWGKIISLVPNNTNIKDDGVEYYQNIDNLVQKLKETDFDFALIGGVVSKTVIQQLDKQNKLIQNTLF